MLWQIFGALLVGSAIASWLSLLTWSISDPSLNHVTDRAPDNLLGPYGAALADLLIQSFGLASIFFPLPLAALGLRILYGFPLERPRLAIAAWPTAIVLFGMSFSQLPVPKSWPLAHGLGGITGDFFMVLILRLFEAVPRTAATIASSLLAAGIGFRLLIAACGLRPDSLEILWTTRSAGSPNRRWAILTAIGGLLWQGGRLVAAHLVPRRTGWGIPPTRRGETGPREFWMREGWDRARGEQTEDADEAMESGFGDTEFRPSFSRFGNSSGKIPGPAERIEPFFESLGGNKSASPDRPDDSPNPARHAERAPTPWPARHEPGGANAFSGKPVRSEFTLPPIRLLNRPPHPPGQNALTDKQLMERAELLEGVLKDFGVKGYISEVHPGPVITLYELKPARGTKSSRVIGLADDIARSMSAVSARVSVIPGRDAIGIELPNEDRETVYLRELLESPEFRASKAKLALALGKTIAGEPVTVDLARMPHLLIAGTTGSGKSVAINTMVLSLIYRLLPDQCKFIMIDPKMLELSVYDGIPHLLTPVVTDPRKAIVALKWVVAEMNRRYELMCKLGVRNILSFNQKVRHAREQGAPLVRTVKTGFDEDTGEAIYVREDMEPELMPYIVIVIDEMADLMMVAGKDIEFAVQRLSQMARAAGIHLIMATQRPSVDVITGTIKANFPSRISFQVTSKIDSRTILGEQGAEQLLGAGDMLYMAPGGRIIRAHGPFVSDGEVEKVVQFLKAQGAPEYRADVLEGRDEPNEPTMPGSGEEGGDLYSQAVNIVLRDRKPTTSYLQRRLGIGYNRAASLIERMEEEGIVSPANRSGKREILVDDEPEE